MEKKIICVMLAVIMTTLVSCGEKKYIEKETDYKEIEETVTTAEEDTENKISETVCENVVLNCEMLYPDSEIYEYRAEVKPYDGEQIYKYFYPNEGKEQWEVSEVDFLKSPYNEYRIQGTDGGRATISDYLYYCTGHWQYMRAFGPIDSENEIGSGFPENEELEFCSINEAEKQVQEFIRKCGYENAYVEKVYTLDHKIMEEVESEAMAEGYVDAAKENDYTGKASWDETDDAYLFRMTCIIDGMPVDTFGYTKKDDSIIPGGKITVGYGASGIEYVYTQAKFEVIEDTGRKVQLLPKDVILNSLAKKYNLVITDAQVIFKDVHLIYFLIPVQGDIFQFDLVPAWQFTSENSGYVDRVYINAETGEELYKE